ncbi:glycosyltransferase family 4 protein [Cobetia sp. 5-25-4-2]|uniref:glycosyltransferase family 4 protein n=1 Tax=Cobetia sp. 5-25-4-2 TaxID=2737459 RepID=UPI001596A0FA|nr:glycosyltransferase family 4 protein [Cobetia sp. 5-25-4-2]
MKVALVVPDINTIGGVERVALNLNKGFRAIGIESHIISLFSKYDKNDKNEVINLALKKPKNAISRYFNKNKITSEVDRLSFDIIIGGNFFRYYANARYNTPCKKIEIHHMCYQESYVDLSIVEKIKLKLRDTNYKRLDNLITLTKKDENRFIDCNVNNVTCIENWLTFKDKEPSTLINKKAIAIGRLTQQKGFDRLIKDWAEIIKLNPDWQLEIYGEGPEQRNLLFLIESYNLKDSIKIYNFSKNIDSKIRESSLLLFTSRYEGFGLVILEALSLGVPCIAYDCDSGPSDIITDGEDGFLIPYENTDMFVEKATKLMKNSGLRVEFGMQAMKNSLRFSEDKILRKWEDLFNQIGEER